MENNPEHELAEKIIAALPGEIEEYIEQHPEIRARLERLIA